MEKADVNLCSENGLALNLSIYFSLSPNVTRIAFFCALKTGFNSKREVAFSEKISEMQQNMTGNTTRSNETSTSGAMQPNTVSPHMRGKKKEDICKPFSSYKDEAVSPELKDSLLDFVGDTERTFKTIGSGSSRDVLYYGDYGYRYSGGENKAQLIPEVIKTLIESVKPHLPNPETALNSCLISRYSTGTNCIPPHRDDEAVIDPESDIITVSIGAERTMTFANNDGDAVELQVLKTEVSLYLVDLHRTFGSMALTRVNQQNLGTALHCVTSLPTSSTAPLYLVTLTPQTSTLVVVLAS